MCTLSRCEHAEDLACSVHSLTLRLAGAQAVEGTLVSAISFVKTLANTHQHELDLLRSQVRALSRSTGCHACALVPWVAGSEL